MSWLLVGSLVVFGMCDSYFIALEYGGRDVRRQRIFFVYAFVESVPQAVENLAIY